MADNVTNVTTTPPVVHQTTAVDPGLGFDAFLASTPPAAPEPTEPDKTEPSPANGAPPVSAPPATEPVEEKPAEKTPAAKPEAGAAPSKLPATPAPNWDAEENPHRQRAVQLEKQYTDTRNWATQISQANAALKREIEILGKKIEGTYDPATDLPVQPSPEDISVQAELIGKVKASIAIAEQQFGAAEVHKQLFADGAPYRQIEDAEPAVKARVLASPAPALEAMRVLKERAFMAQYGQEPEAIRTKIREEYKTELESQIDALVEKKLKERLTLAQDNKTPSLGEVRGSGTPDTKGNAPVHLPLSQLGNPGLA